LQDPKSRLQEWAQAHGGTAPVYRTIKEQGPDHDKIFEVVVIVDDKIQGAGIGHSKQAAAKTAAKAALQNLNID
jgi:ribonuclease-3